MAKILCPHHNDLNPSMEVYPNGRGYCFVCNKTSDLSGQIDIPIVDPKEPEDLKATFRYIDSLPHKQHRGLMFKTNLEGFFIEWPDRDYYKFRKFTGEPRYRAPRGHKQPLFSNSHHYQPSLILIEGELNALSLAWIMHPHDYRIMSPGPAGNFISMKQELLTLAKNYKSVLIWCDEDAPGIKAIWELAPEIPNCKTYISTKDANDHLMDKTGPALMDQIRKLIYG